MSVLTDTIYTAYAHTADDTKRLIRIITERRRAVWINTLSELARKHGCSRDAGTPKGADAKRLADDSKRDAESITQTYNRELRNQIERLYKANPRANRQTYTSNLAKWEKKRALFKNYTIALNTDGTARQYAFSRFYANNPNLGRRFAAMGVPPVCKICIRIFAAGVVDYAYTQRNVLPAHIGCPHFFGVVAPAKAECANLWLG